MTTRQLLKRHEEEATRNSGSDIKLFGVVTKEALRRSQLEMVATEDEDLGRTTTKRGKNIFVKMFLKLANWLDPDLHEKIDVDTLRSKIFVSDLSMQRNYYFEFLFEILNIFNFLKIK